MPYSDLIKILFLGGGGMVSGWFFVFKDFDYVYFGGAVFLALFCFILSFFLFEKKKVFLLALLFFCLSWGRVYSQESFFWNSGCPSFFQGRITETTAKKGIWRLAVKRNSYKALVYTKENVFSEGELISIKGDNRFCLEKRDLFEGNSFYFYLFSKGIREVFYYPSLHKKGVSSLFFFSQWRKKQEEKIVKNISFSFLAKALFLGEKKDIPSYLKNRFSILGISHIFAVSGLHLGIIFSLSFIFLIIIGWWRLYAFWISIVILWSYVVFIGAPFSAIRSGLMITFLLVAYFLKRRYDLRRVYWLSLFFLLYLNPQWIFDISLQFSYLALGGIIYFFPLFRFFLLRYKKKSIVLDLFLVTLSAEIAVSPLSIFYFGNFSLWSSLVNLMIIPLLPAFLFLGIIFLLGATMAGGLIDVCFSYILRVVYWWSNIPWGNWTGGRISLGYLVVYYIFLLIIYWVLWKFFFPEERLKKF